MDAHKQTPRRSQTDTSEPRASFLTTLDLQVAMMQQLNSLANTAGKGRQDLGLEILAEAQALTAQGTGLPRMCGKVRADRKRAHTSATHPQESAIFLALRFVALSPAARCGGLQGRMLSSVPPCA